MHRLRQRFILPPPHGRTHEANPTPFDSAPGAYLDLFRDALVVSSPHSLVSLELQRGNVVEPCARTAVMVPLPLKKGTMEKDEDLVVAYLNTVEAALPEVEPVVLDGMEPALQWPGALPSSSCGRREEVYNESAAWNVSGGEDSVHHYSLERGLSAQSGKEGEESSMRQRQRRPLSRNGSTSPGTQSERDEVYVAQEQPERWIYGLSPRLTGWNTLCRGEEHGDGRDWAAARTKNASRDTPAGVRDSPDELAKEEEEEGCMAKPSFHRLLAWYGVQPSSSSCCDSHIVEVNPVSAVTAEEEEALCAARLIAARTQHIMKQQRQRQRQDEKAVVVTLAAEASPLLPELWYARGGLDGPALGSECTAATAHRPVDLEDTERVIACLLNMRARQLMQKANTARSPYADPTTRRIRTETTSVLHSLSSGAVCAATDTSSLLRASPPVVTHTVACERTDDSVGCGEAALPLAGSNGERRSSSNCAGAALTDSVCASSRNTATQSTHPQYQSLALFSVSSPFSSPARPEGHNKNNTELHQHIILQLESEEPNSLSRERESSVFPTATQSSTDNSDRVNLGGHRNLLGPMLFATSTESETACDI